jgi:hypothetical protein
MRAGLLMLVVQEGPAASAPAAVLACLLDSSFRCWASNSARAARMSRYIAASAASCCCCVLGAVLDLPPACAPAPPAAPSALLHDVYALGSVSFVDKREQQLLLLLLL